MRSGETKAYLKKQTKYLIEQSKQHETTKQLMQLLAKDGLTNPYHGVTFQSSNQLLVVYLYTSVMLSALLPAADAKKINIVADPAINADECQYIEKVMAYIKKSLPESADSIDKLINSKNFMASCVSEELLRSQNMAALYWPVFNSLMYPAKKANQEKHVDFFHHETRHGSLSQQHRTQFCNVDFTEEQLQNFKKNNIWKETQSREALTSCPIWPPTIENIERFEKILLADRKLGHIDELIRINTKIHNHVKLTSEEREVHKEYLTLLKGSLRMSELVDVPLYSDDIMEYFERHKKFPTRTVWNGMIVKITKIEHSNDIIRIQGVIEDDISAFIYRNRKATDQHELMMQSGNKVGAINEADAWLRTGSTDAAIKKAYPNLWEHHQRDKKCCEEGVVSNCYPTKG